MTISTIAGFSATAGSNTDINGVDIGEGTAPSNINNALRALGALLKNMDTGASTLTSPVMTSATITNATIGGLTYPTSDGSASQYIKTDGNGALSFGTVALTTINSNTNHQVITGTGTPDTLQGESGLTYDGSTLTVQGAITCDGNITALTSDKRLKDFKGKIPSALEKVEKLNGYNFNWNDTAKKLNADIFDDENQVGVSAQEVLEVCPEAVKPAPVNNDYYTVQYEKLVPLLIEAVKDLKAEINEMKEGCKCNDSSR